MNDYKKIELLKLNIKQIFSEIKSNRREKRKYRLDKLIQRLSDNDSEYEIELGILKQLFYKVDSDRIPQSRYRKIKKKYFSITTILMIIAMLGIAFFAPDVIEEMLNEIKESGNYYGMGKLASNYYCWSIWDYWSIHGFLYCQVEFL